LGKTIQTVSPRQVLLITRTMWGAMLMLVLFLAAVFIWLAARTGPLSADKPQVGRGALIIATVLNLAAIPLAYYVRGQIIKRGVGSKAMMQTAYFMAHVIGLAICETAAIGGLAVCLLAEKFFPWVMAMGFTVLAMVLMRPKARLLLPEDHDNPYRQPI
jgi:hypothetical protein